MPSFMGRKFPDDTADGKHEAEKDHQFAELLMRVQTASCTEEDITFLKSREVAVSDPRYPQQALHVFKTNK